MFYLGRLEHGVDHHVLELKVDGGMLRLTLHILGVDAPDEVRHTQQGEQDEGGPDRLPHLHSHNYTFLYFSFINPVFWLKKVKYNLG